MIFVIGRASSGKSRFAEDMAVRKSIEYDCQKIYIATMENETKASKQRIAKHRKQREGKGFETIEEMYVLKDHINEAEGKIVLLECVSNLCANVLYKSCTDSTVSDEILDELAKSVFSDIERLYKHAKELIVVSADVFSEGKLFDGFTDNYLKLLALVNKKIAEKSENFIEVCAGIPCKIK